MLDGRGYTDRSADDLVEEFRAATETALAVIDSLDTAAWGRYGVNQGKVLTVLDIGTWQANHNVAHLRQIEVLCATGDRPRG